MAILAETVGMTCGLTERIDGLSGPPLLLRKLFSWELIRTESYSIEALLADFYCFYASMLPSSSLVNSKTDCFSLDAIASVFSVI